MEKQEFVFGANIIENLTTGMYRDPMVLYREYIQNACDSIDKAVKEGVLGGNQEGSIDIWLDEKKRSIQITDNGVGIPSIDFKRVLGDIANSDKTLGEDKGFRGIGRLCGLAYCDKLKFESRANGESIVSILICDAQKMRTLLAEHQSKKRRLSAQDVLVQIYIFSTRVAKDNEEEHFFSVTLENINSQSNKLLDIVKVKEYLSFVAPVPYQNTFIFRGKIYDKAKDLGLEIDEYQIKINEEVIYKKYVIALKEKDGTKRYDEIEDVHFKTFTCNGKMIAWMWVAVCQFKKAIPKANLMRGLRLRKQNIQIGDEDALQKLFKEDRGNSYFVGEVFALDNDLIPNSQRDGFNQNQANEEFETVLREYFNTDIHKTYYNASFINSNIKKIEQFTELERKLEETASGEGFVGEGQREQMEREVEEARGVAEKALKDIEKKVESVEPDTLQGQVVAKIKKKWDDRAVVLVAPSPPIEEEQAKTKKKFRTDNLSRLNKNERKLVGQIFEVIFANMSKDLAEDIVSKIEEALK